MNNNLKPSKSELWLTISSLVAIASFLIHEIYSLDIWWQVTIGKDILKDLTLSFNDKFAAAALGRPYHDSHWLFQVVMALADKALGMTGVQIIMILIWTLTLFYCWKSVRKWLSPGWSSILIFLVAMSSVERFLPRPEIFTFLMISIFYFRLLEGKYRKITDIIILAILQVIWTNTHGLFVIGPFLIVCYMFPKIISLDIKDDKKDRQSLFILLLIITVATFISPWGINGWKYAILIFKEAGSNAPDLLKSVQELSPTFGKAAREGFAFWFFSALILITLISLINGIAKKRMPNLARLLILTAMFLAAITGRRNMVLFALVSVPFVAEHCRFLKTKNIKYSSIINYVVGFLLILFAWLPASGRFYLIMEIPARFGVGATPSFFPHGIKNFLDEINFNDQVYNSNKIGGFFLYNNYPERIPLTDGRWEIYDHNEIQLIQNAATNPLIMKKMEETYNIEGLLLQHASKESLNLIPVIRRNSSWKLVYLDYSSSFWIKKDAEAYHFVPEISVDNHILPPAERLDDNMMLEMFLEGIKSKRLRMENLNQIIESGWREERFLERKAKMLLELNELEQAREVFYAILNINKRNEFALNELAYIEFVNGNQEKAENLLLQLLKVNPQNTNAQKNLARIRNRKNN